ncbi:hypothetical protein [Brevirhabdus sp.]|uniref:hypothetical protein n=1 Tax=Brevirhabdus sp. TaxID=2004514 RepID=UPI0040599FC9
MSRARVVGEVVGRAPVALPGLVFVVASPSADMSALPVASPGIAARFVGKRREGIAA